MRPVAKLAFTTCAEELVPAFLAAVAALPGEAPLYVCGEFPPPPDTPGLARWIPWNPARSFADNTARLAASLDGLEILYAAVVFERHQPYADARLWALLRYPHRAVVYQSDLHHFMLRPASAPAGLRALYRALRDYLHELTHPGGALYTFAWRLGHPRAFRRPVNYLLARLAGHLGPRLSAPRPQPLGPALPPGISIVIPSREGHDLLDRLLASLLPQLPEPAEILIVDNGSATPYAHPAVRTIVSAGPLSFAAAVNTGIARARYARLCLLNNDMVLEPGFFTALEAAFAEVPDLFAATAQIFLPPGQRREETGKAMYAPSRRHLPLTCAEPLAGEDHTWVLYGSGGCTLYDTARLRALGCFAERYTPAYVEDLDIGYRAWQRGWPSVYVAQARVLHLHRSTTAKVFTPLELACAVERNYVKFVLTATGPHFPALWREAMDQLNWRAALQIPEQAADQVLSESWRMCLRRRRVQRELAVAEAEILALNTGSVALFPGRPATPGRPRLLVATPYLPYPLAHGGAVRIFHLLTEAAREFDIVLLSFVDELAPPPAPLLALAAEVTLVRRLGSHLYDARRRPDVVADFDRPDFRAALRWAIRKWRPGLVQLEFTQMALYLPDCAPARTILVEHDITIDLYSQLLAQSPRDWELRRQHALWESFERQAWRRADAVVVMSERDRAQVPSATLLPNGVDLTRFSPAAAGPEPGRLLFIGSFGHLPNLLALRFFLTEVWPLLAGRGLRLHIIAGPGPEAALERHRDQVRLPLDQPGIELEAFVADVRPAYARAAAVIAPLTASAGTNIKVLEAMAMARPVISTPAGVHGLAVTPNRDVLIAAAPADFAAAIAAVLTDPALARRLGAAARATVEASYGWDRIGRDQAALYHRLLGVN